MLPDVCAGARPSDRPIEIRWLKGVLDKSQARLVKVINEHNVADYIANL
jgi:hypothetical protein